MELVFKQNIENIVDIYRVAHKNVPIFLWQ